MNRTLAVARMQLVNKQTFVWVPLIITAVAFVISWLIAAIITTRSGPPPRWARRSTAPARRPCGTFSRSASSR
ncbi:hypothetical protein GCM10023065_31690 [Microbacterium laevaniformans]|uniref:hypothetical protein n=1 Tax=Microbacterium laevaniformans TaxID=36807 RepID=UPI0031E72D81